MKKNVPHKECQFCGFHHIPRRDKCSEHFKACRTCYEKNHFQFNYLNQEQKMYRKKSCETYPKGEKNFYRPRVYYRDTASDENTDEDEYVHEVIAVFVDKKSKDAKCMLLKRKVSSSRLTLKQQSTGSLQNIRSLLSYTRTS